MFFKEINRRDFVVYQFNHHSPISSIFQVFFFFPFLCLKFFFILRANNDKRSFELFLNDQKATFRALLINVRIKCFEACSSIQTIEARESKAEICYKNRWCSKISQRRRKKRNRINGISQNNSQQRANNVYLSDASFRNWTRVNIVYCRSNNIEPRDLLAEIARGALSRFCARLLVKKHFTVSSRYSRRDWLGRGRKGAPRRLKFHDKRPLQREES